jgi:PRTRC genetic system protein A
VAILQHSADSVVYERPVLGAHEHLVVDMHSHGAHRAGFSAQDNQDDHGALQVSYCVGSLDREAPTKATCARVLGVTLPGTSIRVGARHAASV